MKIIRGLIIIILLPLWASLLFAMFLGCVAVYGKTGKWDNPISLFKKFKFQ